MPHQLAAVHPAGCLSRTGLRPLATETSSLAPGPFGRVHAVEHATENLVANPSFEVNTSGWFKTAGATTTRVTSDAAQGSACLEVTTPGAVEGVFCTFPATIGQAYTVSAWVKAAAGKSLTIRLQEDAGAKSDIATATEVQDGGWCRMRATGVATQITMRLRVDVGADASGFTFLLDAAQAEQGAWASSYVDGSLGEGYAWTGTAHGSSSTRAAGRLRVEAAWMDASRGGVAAFLRPHWGAAEAAEHVVLHRSAGPDDEMRLAFQDGDWRLSSRRGGTESSVAVPASHAGGDDVVVVAGWMPRALVLEVGGVRATAARTGGPPDLRAARRLDVGRRQDEASGWLDGVVGPLVFFDAPPTPRAAAALRRLRRPPRWGESFGTQP